MLQFHLLEANWVGIKSEVVSYSLSVQVHLLVMVWKLALKRNVKANMIFCEAEVSPKAFFYRELFKRSSTHKQLKN